MISSCTVCGTAPHDSTNNLLTAHEILKVWMNKCLNTLFGKVLSIACTGAYCAKKPTLFCARVNEIYYLRRFVKPVAGARFSK